MLFPAVSESEAMGHFGRITATKDLPSKEELTAVFKQAMKLNDAGAKSAVRPRTPPAELVVPQDFAGALEADAAALKVFTAGSVSFKREYRMWIEDAKAEATRVRRMAQAVEWQAEGKARNWKYDKC